MKTLISTLAGLTVAAGLALSGGVAHASTDLPTKGYGFQSQTLQEALTSYERKVVKPKHAANYHDLTNALAERLPNCVYEDSRNCFWDAGNRGNGIGDSFVQVRGTYYYFQPHRDEMSSS